jgi:hypothetical protein
MNSEKIQEDAVLHPVLKSEQIGDRLIVYLRESFSIEEVEKLARESGFMVVSTKIKASELSRQYRFLATCILTSSLSLQYKYNIDVLSFVDAKLYRFLKPYKCSWLPAVREPDKLIIRYDYDSSVIFSGFYEAIADFFPKIECVSFSSSFVTNVKFEDGSFSSGFLDVTFTDLGQV